MMMTLATLLKFAKMKCVQPHIAEDGRLYGCFMGCFFTAVIYLYSHLSVFFKRILQAESQCLNVTATNMQRTFLSFLMLNVKCEDSNRKRPKLIRWLSSSHPVM